MRRFALALFAVLWLASSVRAAAAFVQAATAFTTGANASTTFASVVASGNLITVSSMTLLGSSSATLNSVDDNCGNTYTIVRTTVEASGQNRLSTAYAKNVTGGSACTVTAHYSASADVQLYIEEWSGLDPTSPLDVETGQAQTNPGSGANAVTSGAVTTTVSGALIYGSTMKGAATDVMSPGTGFTNINLTGSCCGTEYKIAGAAGSNTATATATTGTGDFATNVMAFKPAAASGGTPARRRF